jgi:hypothetical protein
MADITTSPPLSGRLQALCLARPVQVWLDGDATSGRAYTEQVPRPGLPRAGRDTHAVLVPSGPVTGTADYSVRVQHGGVPGQVDHGMTVATQRAGETLWMGWEQPGSLSGYEVIDSTISGQQTDVVAMPSGALVATGRAGLSARVWTKAAGAASWTARGVVTTTPTGETPTVYYPALVVINAEVYLLAWREGVAYDPAVGGSADSSYFIAVWRSVDDGATWSMAQDFATIEEDVRDDTIVATDPATGEGTLFACGRIRAAYRDNEVVVFAHLKGHRLDAGMDRIRQWAGAALTARLDLVETTPAVGAVTGIGLPDVAAVPWGFAVAWLKDGVSSPFVGFIGSAWQPSSTSGAAAIATPFDIKAGYGWTATGLGTARTLLDASVGEVAIVYDPAGAIWLYTAASIGASLGAGVQYAYYSTDGGRTWTPGEAFIPAVTDVSGFWFYPGDLGAGLQGNRPHRIAATWWRGAVVVVSGSEGDVEGSGWLHAMYLGGPTDLALPYERHGVRIGHRTGWLRTWLPFELPEDQAGYTPTTAGTSSSALAVGAHNITTGDGLGVGAAGRNFFTHLGVDNGGLQLGIGMGVAAVNTTQGNAAACDIGQRMRLASATHGVEMEIVRTRTSITVRDFNLPGQLAQVAGLVDTGRVAVRWGMSMVSDTGAGRALQVWYRELDGSSREKRQWIRIGAWVLADDAGAGGVVPHYVRGHIASSGDTTINDSDWYEDRWSFPYFSTGASPGAFATWHDLNQAGGDNPGKLAGRPLGSEQDWLLDGMTLAGRRGPAIIGDFWTIPVSGEYEIARALSLDVPSRRVHHRTVDVSASVVIPWAADAERPHVEDAEHPPVMALHIQCNWRLATLQYKTVAGAWTTHATIDTRVMQGVTYTRTGKFFRATSTADATYLHRDEVDSLWTVEWDDGAGVTRYRHPAGNSPGRWSSAVTEPRARLELANTIAGDPTTGGTLSLWSPEVTVLVPTVTATAWRLVIDSTHGTADGDYRTKFAWGEAHVFAQPADWGRGYTAIPGHQRADLEGGLGVRVDRAPAARALRMAWDSSVDESEIGGSAQVRYVTPWSAASEPAACVGEIPRSLVRMLERQAGRPVGWCVWDRVASAAVVLRRKHEQLWGTVESAPDLEVVLGQEGDTETVRVSTVTVREEP